MGQVDRSTSLLALCARLPERHSTTPYIVHRQVGEPPRHQVGLTPDRGTLADAVQALDHGQVHFQAGDHNEFAHLTDDDNLCPEVPRRLRHMMLVLAETADQEREPADALLPVAENPAGPKAQTFLDTVEEGPDRHLPRKLLDREEPLPGDFGQVLDPKGHHGLVGYTVGLQRIPVRVAAVDDDAVPVEQRGGS